MRAETPTPLSGTVATSVEAPSPAVGISSVVMMFLCFLFLRIEGELNRAVTREQAKSGQPHPNVIVLEDANERSQPLGKDRLSLGIVLKDFSDHAL